MLRAYGSWIPTANLVLIPNSIKNNLKDVCINKGLKPACPVGRPMPIDTTVGSGLPARSLGRRVAQVWIAKPVAQPNYL